MKVEKLVNGIPVQIEVFFEEDNEFGLADHVGIIDMNDENVYIPAAMIEEVYKAMKEVCNVQSNA